MVCKHVINKDNYFILMFRVAIVVKVDLNNQIKQYCNGLRSPFKHLCMTSTWDAILY